MENSHKLSLSPGSRAVLPDCFVGVPAVFQLTISGMSDQFTDVTLTARKIGPLYPDLTTAKTVVGNVITVTVAAPTGRGWYEIEVRLVDNEGVPMNREASVYLMLVVES